MTKSRKPKLNERRDVVEPVLQWLAATGWLVLRGKINMIAARTMLATAPAKGVAWRMNTGGFVNSYGHHVRFGKAGIADIIGIQRDGRWLAIECKLPGNVPTAEQSAFLDIVRMSGGKAIVATCVEDVKDELMR